MSENLIDLVKIIRDRKNKDKDKSYTSSLLSSGLSKCIDKMEEEFGELKEEYINEITRMTTNEITRGAGTSNERGESSMPHPSNPVGKLRKTSMETDPLNFSPGVPGRMTGEVLTYKCSECGIVKEGLLRCGVCKSVHYCSAEHQKLHWKHHKVFCYQNKVSKKNDGY